MTLNKRRATKSGAFSASTQRAGTIFRPTALEMTYVEQLHRIISALLDKKIASSSGGYER